MPRRALHTASHGAGSWRGRTGSSRDRRGGSPIQFRFGALRLRPSAPGARGSGARSCRRACALRRKASARALAACAFYAAWSTQFWRTNSATARRTSSLRRTRKRRESWDTLRSSCAVILTSSFLSRTGNFTAMPMLYHKPPESRMIPEYERLVEKFEVRMGRRLRDRIEVLARFAKSRSVSDYLRAGIEEFLDREQRRLGLSDAQLATGAEMLRKEKASARKVKPMINPRRNSG